MKYIKLSKFEFEFDIQVIKMYSLLIKYILELQ